MRKQRLVIKGRDRLVFDALRLMSGDKASYIAKRADLSGTTVYNMRREPKKGGTMYPRALTLAKIAQAYGHTLEFVPQQGHYTESYIA